MHKIYGAKCLHKYFSLTQKVIYYQSLRIPVSCVSHEACKQPVSSLFTCWIIFHLFLRFITPMTRERRVAEWKEEFESIKLSKSFSLSCCCTQLPMEKLSKSWGKGSLHMFSWRWTLLVSKENWSVYMQKRR